MTDLRELAEAANRPTPPSMHHGFINDDYLVWEAARRAFEEAATPFAVLALLDAAEARAPLDVERLARALWRARKWVAPEWVEEGVSRPDYATTAEMAAAIAREYAALEEPTDE